MNATFTPPPQTAFVAGTIVLTAEGAIPVELLGPGDRIITRNTGIMKIGGIAFFRRFGDFVTIAAGSLGPQMPQRDTVLAADHPILLRGRLAMDASGQTSCLVAAVDLAQALPEVTGLALLRGGEKKMVHLTLETNQIVYADGLETLCASTTSAMTGA